MQFLERGSVKFGARRDVNFVKRLALRQFDGLILLQHEQTVELLRNLHQK